jgi:hypothetical protein
MKRINYVYEVAGTSSYNGELSRVIDGTLHALGLDYLIVDGKHGRLSDVIDSLQNIKGDYDYIVIFLPMSSLLSRFHLN